MGFFAMACRHYTELIHLEGQAEVTSDDQWMTSGPWLSAPAGLLCQSLQPVETCQTWLDVACTYIVHTGYLWSRAFKDCKQQKIFWELGVCPVYLVIADNFWDLIFILQPTSIGGLSVVTYPNNFHCSHFSLAVARRAENYIQKA